MAEIQSLITLILMSMALSIKEGLDGDGFHLQ
jgi:hypothetical protein